MKTCTRCKKDKELEDFGRDKSRSDGRFPHCKECHARAQTAYRKIGGQAYVGKQQIYHSQWRANRDANAEARANYLAQGTLYSLKHRYGLTAQDLLDLVAQQKGVCAICSKSLQRKPGMKGALHVDHDHSTGKIRGLLCGSCNTGLGCFTDDTQKLARAIKYLTSPSSKK